MMTVVMAFWFTYTWFWYLRSWFGAACIFCGWYWRMKGVDIGNSFSPRFLQSAWLWDPITETHRHRHMHILPPELGEKTINQNITLLCDDSSVCCGWALFMPTSYCTIKDYSLSCTICIPKCSVLCWARLAIMLKRSPSKVIGAKIYRTWD